MLRKLAAGVLLAAALTLPLAGCRSAGTTATGGASPAASRSPKPTEILTAVIAKSQGTSFALSLGDKNDSLKGSYDAANKAVRLDTGGFDFVCIGSALYVSGFPGTDSGKYLRVDPAKLTADSTFAVLADPLAGLRFVVAAGSVDQPTSGHFTGTSDLTKVSAGAPAGTKLVVDFLTKQTRGGVTALPFTATVDDQGRLTQFSTTFPAADDGKDIDYVLTLSDFGTKATVTAPDPAKVEDAPPSFYQKVNTK